MSEFYVLFWEISPGVERNNMRQLAVGKTTLPAPQLQIIYTNKCTGIMKTLLEILIRI